MDLDLAGKKAIVSGGSKGIGRAIVETLLAEGASVAFCARGKRGVDDTVEALSGKGDVYGCALDVSDAAAVESWVEQAAGQLGGIDVVVGNTPGTGGSSSVTEEAFLSHLRVDLLSFVRMVDAALPALTYSSGASVVSIASTVVVEHFGAGACAFNAIKAALVNYTAGLSQKLAVHGIRANVVSPGPVFVEGGAWDHLKDSKPEFYEATEATIPLGRFGRPDDIARMVAFLASPAACFVTGENIIVDGGLTRRVAY